MELVLSLVALVAGGAAFALALDARAKAARIAELRQRVDDQQRVLEAMQQELGSVQTRIETTRTAVGELDGGLESARRDLAELRAAADALPAPPLPRASRAGGLDDLRAQLRAAHREPDDADEA